MSAQCSVGWKSVDSGFVYGVNAVVEFEIDVYVKFGPCSTVDVRWMIRTTSAPFSQYVPHSCCVTLGGGGGGGGLCGGGLCGGGLCDGTVALSGGLPDGAGPLWLYIHTSQPALGQCGCLCLPP